MRADVYVMSKPNVRFSGVVDSVGFGVTPDPDRIGHLGPGLPDVQRTLNWVHLASRYPVRVRVGESSARSVSSERVSGRHDSRTLKMATRRSRIPDVIAPLAWLREFLKQELAPYPGRAAVVGAHGHRRDSHHDRLHDISHSVRLSRRHLCTPHFSRKPSSHAAINGSHNNYYGYQCRIPSALGAFCYQYSRASFSLGRYLFLPGLLCAQRRDQLHRGSDFRHYEFSSSSLMGLAMCRPKRMWKIHCGCVYQ